MIIAAHPNILRGESSTVSVLAWNSRETRRVVRRSLGAECAAFSTGLEYTDMFRVLYGEFCGGLCDLAEYETYLQMTGALCVNECKSLADVLLAAGTAASKTSEDKRLGNELIMIKQCLFRNETRFQWVEGATMLADVLTKGKEQTCNSVRSSEVASKAGRVLQTDYSRVGRAEQEVTISSGACCRLGSGPASSWWKSISDVSMELERVDDLTDSICD